MQEKFHLFFLIALMRLAIIPLILTTLSFNSSYFLPSNGLCCFCAMSDFEITGHWSLVIGLFTVHALQSFFLDPRSFFAFRLSSLPACQLAGLLACRLAGLFVFVVVVFMVLQPQCLYLLFQPLIFFGLSLEEVKGLYYLFAHARRGQVVHIGYLVL